MKIHSTNLPTAQRFSCTRKEIKELFSNTSIEWIGFAWPSKKFEFDSRCHHRPKINGQIIASLSINHAYGSHLCFYPVKTNEYPDQAALEFKQKVLPRLHEWFCNQMSKPDTQKNGNFQFIVEWHKKSHKMHEMSFM